MKRLIIIVYLVISLTFFNPIAEAENLPIAKFSRIKPIRANGDTEMERMLQIQKYWKEVSLESLNLFREADQMIIELIEFMDKNAIYSIPIGPKATKFIMTIDEWKESQKNPFKFEIVFMPEEYAESMPSSIYTEGGGRVIRVATNFQIKEWLGIMLSHELFHVYDQLVKGENANDPEQNLMGEVEAHLLEIKLLKFWSEKAFNLLIKKGTPLYKSRDIKSLLNLFESLYPLSKTLVSEKERSLGAGSLLIAIAFEESLRKGGTKKELGEIYKSFLK